MSVRRANADGTVAFRLDPAQSKPRFKIAPVILQNESARQLVVEDLKASATAAATAARLASQQAEVQVAVLQQKLAAASEALPAAQQAHQLELTALQEQVAKAAAKAADMEVMLRCLKSLLCWTQLL